MKGCTCFDTVGRVTVVLPSALWVGFKSVSPASLGHFLDNFEDFSPTACEYSILCCFGAVSSFEGKLRHRTFADARWIEPVAFSQ